MGKQLTQEEAIAKIISVHGKKYDLSQVVYTGSHGWVKAICSNHGVFEIKFRDFTKKISAGGCQECSKEAYLEGKEYWNAVSSDEAEIRLLAKFGDLYSFDMASYVAYSKPMNVLCPKHGLFKLSPSKMMNIGVGCPDCGKLKSSSTRTKGIATRLDEAIDRFGGKFIYSEAPVKANNKTEFHITCTLHNTRFLTSWNRHLSLFSLGGCEDCYKDLMRNTHLHGTADFIRISDEQHAGRYGYSRSVYTAHKDLVEIECKEHGFFWQRADKHKIGHGCDKCVKNGFRNTKPAHLYVLQEMGRVKVGITNRSLKTRVSEINVGGGGFKLISSFFYDIGLDCRNHETRLLQYLRSLYKNTEGTFDGVTESFEKVDATLVLKYIEEMRNKEIHE